MRTNQIRYILLLSFVLVSACGKFSTNDLSSSIDGAPDTSIPAPAPDVDEPSPERQLEGEENEQQNSNPGRQTKPGENPATVTVTPDETTPAATPAPAQQTPQTPKQEEPDVNPSLGSIMYTKGQLKPEEIAESGYIKPTIYDFPIFNEDAHPCSNEQDLLDVKGNPMMQVCPETLSSCGLQGSCAVIKDGERIGLNVKTRISGKDRFFEIGDDCPFGYGVRNICLDPFFTLAADLGIYKPGEVIFVPSIEGLVLPNGKKHDGYFVIRDQGRGIKGKGRFDFFSGYYRWRNKNNPFTKIGLGSVKTNVPYYKVKGPRVDAIKGERGFPKLPAKPIDQMPANQ